MKIDISPSRREYLDSTGKIVLKACPGSGKTTTISYKLNQLIEKSSSRAVHRIACLSFTNIAKDEIAKKYVEFSGKSIGHPHLVSTIDSFINSFITLPFHYLVTKISDPFEIVQNDEDLDKYWSSTKFFSKDKRQLQYLYKPSTISRNAAGFYTSNGHRPKADKVDLKVFDKYAAALKKWQKERRILTNNDSAYCALLILRNFPRVAQFLAKKFNYIIVDEAQDTSEIQYNIFSELTANGLQNIELVGDPYQCLYEWRNATPQQFLQKWKDPEWKQLDLNENWRSSQPIISCYSVLREAEPLIECMVGGDAPKPIHVVRYKDGSERAALSIYRELCEKYKENQVLVRSNETVKLLTSTTENTEFWKSQHAQRILQSVINFKNRQIKKAIDDFRFTALAVGNADASYDKLIRLNNDAKNDADFNGVLIRCLNSISNLEETLLEWTSTVSSNLTKHLKITPALNFTLKKHWCIKHYGEKMEVLLKLTDNPLPFDITTIHAAKGATLDTALLFLRKGSLSLNDFKTPNLQSNEKQRMLYVAMSRPRHLLAVAVQDIYDEKAIRATFGPECVII